MPHAPCPCPFPCPCPSLSPWLSPSLTLPLPLPQVVRYLVRSNPAAASARRGVGRLPVHYACFADEPDVDIIRCLLEVDYRPV